MLNGEALPSNLLPILKAESGKLDIKRRKPGILFISLPLCAIFEFMIITKLSIFPVLH